MKFYNFLNEATFSIEKSDIEMLYDPLDEGFERIKQAIIKKDEHELDIIKSDVFNLPEIKGRPNSGIIETFSSDDLESEICKAAHDIRPIKIIVGIVSPVGNPFEDEIHCGIDTSVFNKKRIKKRLIMGSIRHELTHGLDDTFNENYITKIYKSQDGEYIKSFGKGDIEATDGEIKAQVDAIDEVRRHIRKNVGRKLSFDNIIKIMGGDHKKNDSYGVKRLKEALKSEGLI